MPVPALTPPCALVELWAVRHGESTANAVYADPATARRTEPLPGLDRDVPLSRRGVAQATALGGWLAARDPGLLVVCSPYLRARETWRLMAEAAGLPPGDALVDDRLRDREQGVFALHPPAAVRALDPREAERRARVGTWYHRPPGGEALTDVMVRVGQFLTELSRAATGRRVLLVAHDAVVVAVRQYFGGIGHPVPDRLPPVPNASVSHWVSESGRLGLVDWAGVDHLTR
ncbi:histidine phosphatase family protein [Streptomyces sp. SPB074]|uniref:histidine phosphatase family protein n=1 Tax=Streptomyces sp. (strain SPB074) TaxID=465543 RepID=UPI000565AF59|nr:histidine phosphatase family protein [Streptomyces sp. SPB074]